MDRQTIANRIQALLKKTKENGCTEEEAAAAAEKAYELLNRYQMSQTDLEIEAEGAIKIDLPWAKGVPGDAHRALVYGISRFCTGKAWNEPAAKQSCFIGLRSDAELAGWLYTSLLSYIMRKAAFYQLEYSKREANDFMLGCAYRIRDRLIEEVAKRRQVGTGRDLVVVKKPLIDMLFLSLGISLHAGRGLRAGTTGGFAHGQAAGNSATFGRPVRSATARIGHSKS